MALEIKRKEKETPRSLVRNFSRRVKRSGVLNRMKKRAHVIRKKSKQAKIKTALRRNEKRAIYEKKKKLGIKK